MGAFGFDPISFICSVLACSGRDDGRFRIAPSEPRKSPKLGPRATNLARASDGFRLACPWLGSKISGRPESRDTARGRSTAELAEGLRETVSGANEGDEARTAA